MDGLAELPCGRRDSNGGGWEEESASAYVVSPSSLMACRPPPRSRPRANGRHPVSFGSPACHSDSHHYRRRFLVTAMLSDPPLPVLFVCLGSFLSRSPTSPLPSS